MKKARTIYHYTSYYLLVTRVRFRAKFKFSILNANREETKAMGM